MKRTPFKKRVSPEHRRYLSRRPEYLNAHPNCLSYQFPIPYECQCACTDRSTDIHHRAKRGRLLNEEKYWLPVCRNCHDYIENHKSWARSVGLLLDPRNLPECQSPSGSFLSPPPDAGTPGTN